ncbi:hypothetical protein EON63_04945 [archaeon]|nr:MAG: hypothetical protein EON63_04945 [archaeon]
MSLSATAIINKTKQTKKANKVPHRINHVPASQSLMKCLSSHTEEQQQVQQKRARGWISSMRV